MNQHNTTGAAALPTHASGTQSTSWWGMMLFLATEAAFFASLIASYFYVRFNVPEWPLGGIEPPELLLPGLMTVILLSSSVFMHLGEQGIRRGDQGRLKMGLGLSLLLGAIFLSLQVYEYSSSTFTPQTNAYASLFFTITGLHGSHVLVGLLIGVLTLVRSWRGHFSGDNHVAVQNTALYWHFVDAVWIVVFSSLYIYPHLLG